MLIRWLPRLAVLAVVVAPVPTRAGAAEKVRPVTLVRIRSLDALFQDAKYLATLAGEEERARQVEGIIKARIGDKGLDGIDPKRPLGVYTRDLVDISPVAMVPVADEKALVKLLKGLNLTVEKNKDGYYTIPLDFLPVETSVHFRIANGYAYVTSLDTTAIDKDKLLDAEMLKGSNPNSLVSVTLNLANVSQDSKQLALGQLETQTNKLKQKQPPRETAAQKEVRESFFREVAATGASVIKEGGEVTLQLDVDRQKGRVAFQLSLAGKSGSNLRRKIADLGRATSLFAGVTGEDLAARGLAHITLPADVRRALEPVVDHALKELPQKEQDPGKREMIERALKALAPTVKAGELDGAVILRGPSANGQYTLATGIKVRDAAEVEKVVRDIVAKVAPHTEKVKVKFDADKADDVAIHRIDVRGDVDKKFVKAFGNGPFYLAFRKDAVLLTAGDKALDAIKELAAAKPQTGPLFGLEASVARLVPLGVAVGKQDRNSKAAQDAAREVFGQGAKDPGRVRLSLQGGPALTLRLSVSAGVIKFAARAHRESRRRAAEEKE
jgi:hypothetical protein